MKPKAAPPSGRDTAAPPWRDGLALACLALAVRTAHLLLGRADPTWDVPIIDANTYRVLAEDLAAGVPPTAALVWQPLLYPVGLAVLFKLVGASVVAARVVQIVLGAATCLAGWRLAAAWFGVWPARLAGLAIALCGPLVFFEGQLVAAGPSALVATLLLLAADRAGRTDRAGPAAVVGLLAAAAILLRPTFGPAAAGLILWLGLPGAAARPGPAVRRGLVALGATLAVLVPVDLAARAAVGYGAVTPTSASLNLWLGNNPDSAHTLTIRPGPEWDALIAAPLQGAEGDPAAVGQRYYAARVREFVRRSPGDFLRGLGRKILQVICSRELPRNQDIYLQRRWSPVLTVLAGRLGPWGWPGGLLLPLAAYGMIATASRRTAPGLILILATSAALVAVFTSARYRAPLLPAAAVFAAGGLARLGLWRRPDRRRRAALATGAALAVAVLGTAPGPFAQEQVDLAPELDYAVGYVHCRRQQWAPAEAHLRRALAGEPDRADARYYLATVLAGTDRTEEALELLEEAVALAPDWEPARRDLATIRSRLARERYTAARSREADDPAAAAALCAEATRLAPDWPEPVARLAWYAATSRVDSLRDGPRALELARRARRLAGPHPYLQLVLAAALAENGRWTAALAAADSGLALAGQDPDGRWAAELTQARERFAAGRPLRR